MLKVSSFLNMIPHLLRMTWTWASALHSLNVVANWEKTMLPNMVPIVKTKNQWTVTVNQLKREEEKHMYSAYMCNASDIPARKYKSVDLAIAVS